MERYVLSIFQHKNNSNIMTNSLGSTHFVAIKTKLIVSNRDMNLIKDIIACDNIHKELLITQCS